MKDYAAAGYKALGRGSYNGQDVYWFVNPTDGEVKGYGKDTVGRNVFATWLASQIEGMGPTPYDGLSLDEANALYQKSVSPNDPEAPGQTPEGDLLNNNDAEYIKPVNDTPYLPNYQSMDPEYEVPNLLTADSIPGNDTSPPSNSLLGGGGSNLGGGSTSSTGSTGFSGGGGFTVTNNTPPAPTAPTPGNLGAPQGQGSDLAADFGRLFAMLRTGRRGALTTRSAGNLQNDALIGRPTLLGS